MVEQQNIEITLIELSVSGFVYPNQKKILDRIILFILGIVYQNLSELCNQKKILDRTILFIFGLVYHKFYANGGPPKNFFDQIIVLAIIINHFDRLLVKREANPFTITQYSIN